ncbi:Intraflagellar transport protein 72/74 [Spironucleus salmonicida]|uniref:Intraflagellar transport protein 72/74 n=1 Tax=Spironucleus salmonicida TaxID=348837 RepID=V6LJ08_9EUKA|nr:Intraflagellar transport protein 72/74 [Spironucleus salmonicida]|eukprot:EST44600.1 Intraflagellar transport protein 72/74 [Spironucleus salmonicida]
MSMPMSRKASARPVSRGAVGVAATGTAATQDVRLSSRPMSNHGLDTGTRVATGTRQVFDAPYFLTDIRNKTANCNREAEALSVSTQELRRKENQFNRLSETVQQLKQQVNNLQGEFTDINYAKSQLDAGASLEDLRSQATAAENQAEKLRNDSNVAYKARVEAQQRLEKNEIAAARIRSETEAKISADLGDEIAREFMKLSQENISLQKQEQELRKKLQEQANQTAIAYSNASVLQNTQGQQNIQKAINIHRNTRQYKREIDALRNELDKGQSDDPEYNIKQQLRNQIKLESNECKRLVEEIKTLEASLVHRKKIFQEIAPDVMTSVTKEQKDMIKNVLKAENQLTQWPRQKQELILNNQKLNQQHLLLLNKMPGPTQSENGQNIDQQLNVKTRELERLSDQESRVLTELREQQSRSQTLKETLQALTSAVGDAESVENVEVAESQLRSKLAAYMDQHKSLATDLADANKRLTESEESIKGSEQAQTLRSLFNGLSASLDKQYKAESYIKSKENDGNYEGDKKIVLELVNKINDILME